jgi:hypothetical protein
VPGVLNPTQNGSNQVVDLDLLGRELGHSTLKAAPKGDAHPALQAPVSRKDDEAQEGHAFGYRPGLGAILVQRQAQGPKPFDDGGAPVTQLPFVVAEEQKVG